MGSSSQHFIHSQHFLHYQHLLRSKQFLEQKVGACAIIRQVNPFLYDPDFMHFVSYSNHLTTGLATYLNGIFVSGCQMVQYSNGGLKTGLKEAC